MMRVKTVFFFRVDIGVESGIIELEKWMWIIKDHWLVLLPKQRSYSEKNRIV